MCIGNDDPLLAAMLNHDAHVIAFWRLVVVTLAVGFAGLDAWILFDEGWQPALFLAAFAGVPTLAAWRLT